jgi:MFS family permease
MIKDKRRFKLWLVIILGIILSLFFFQSAIFNAWMTAYYTDPTNIKYHGRWFYVFIVLALLSLISVVLAIYKLMKKPNKRVEASVDSPASFPGECPPPHP